MPIAVVGLRLRVLLSALALIVLVLLVQPAGAVSPNLVVSQVYGGGGNTGATFTDDFIEIFNRGTTTASTPDGLSSTPAQRAPGTSALRRSHHRAAGDRRRSRPVRARPGGIERCRWVAASDAGRHGCHSHQHVWNGRKGRAGHAIRRLSAATEARRRATRRSWRASSILSGTARRTSSRAPARLVRPPTQPRRYEMGAAASTATTTRPTSRSARRRPGTRQRLPRRASVTRRRRSRLRLLRTAPRAWRSTPTSRSASRRT